MLGHRRPIRRLAATLLLAWVFALVSGVVNACIVGLDSGGPVHVTDQGRAAAVATPHAHDPAPQADAPCAKFCDDESSSVPSSPLSAGQVSFGAWIAPAAWTAWAEPAHHVGAEAVRAEPGAGAARIPIPIAFLRLAL